MMKMVKNSLKILAIIAAGLFAVLSPTQSFSTENIKFSHLISIYIDEAGVGLKQPEGVVCNEKGVLIVVDTGNGRLLRYLFEDRTLAVRIAEIKVSQLVYPVKAKFNSRGEIYVLDGALRRIVRLTPDGIFKNYMDLTESASSAPIVPRSFHIDRDDNMYVLDVISGRVAVFGPDGQFRREIKFSNDKGFFSDLTVDIKGDVLLIDSVNAIVLSASKDAANFSSLTKSLKEYTRFPTNLATDNRGRIYLVDRNGSRIVILGQDGSFLARLSGMGWREGLLNYPSQLCVNDRGEIFIADTLNNRVQIFTMIE